MSAADLLNNVPPMRDTDCAACQLFAHGIHCQRKNRHGQPCACPCRARIALFDCLNAASCSPVPDPCPPGADRRAERDGQAAADRRCAADRPNPTKERPTVASAGRSDPAS